MGLNPDAPEVESRLEHAKMAARIAIAGHEQAAVRRIILWAVVFGSLAVVPVLPAVVVVTLVAATLLALTDQLV